MDDLMQWTGGLGDRLERYFASGDFASAWMVLLFAAVVLTVFGISLLFGSRSTIYRRVVTEDGDKRLQSLSLRRPEEESAWVQFLAPIAKRLFADDELGISAARKRLIQAGFRHPSSVGIYYTLRIAAAAGLPVLLILISPIVSRDTPFQTILFGAFIVAFLGFYMPHLYITQCIARRQRLIVEAFPDALDLLLVCVEAGLGLDAAINRVASDINAAHPILGEQFALVGLELRAGKGRMEALQNLSERTGVEEVGSLVTLLIQSDALGTSIAQALRVHADEMRAKRMLAAEEKAHKLSVKMAAPLVFFILPALMAVVLAPGILEMAEKLWPVLTNGAALPTGTSALGPDSGLSAGPSLGGSN